MDLVIGTSTKGDFNIGIHADYNIFVDKSEEGDWGSREGLAVGLGGQVDYYQPSDQGGRVRMLPEINFGYVNKYSFWGDGDAFKGFVQQDLTSYDTLVGGRATFGRLGGPNLSLSLARNLRQDSWVVGGGVGVLF